MSAEREQEYADLHAYLDYYSTHVSGIDPSSPSHPTNAGKQIVAEFGRSKALDGLRQAVNDTVEELNGRDLAYIEALDSKLRENGLLTVSEVRRRYSSSYRRIVKRGRISSEAEYYLVAGILADSVRSGSETERALLEKLSAQYRRGA